MKTKRKYISTNRKVLIIVSLMLVALSLATVVNVLINFRTFGERTAIEQAHSIAKSVRDGLTSHMVNDTMDKRFIFLENMMRHQAVQNFRVLRAQSVIKQFGKGLVDTYKYDDIEKEVMRSANSVTRLFEDKDSVFMRVTIPYTATKYSNPNCLECHSNVREGDVLGVISMDIDISSVRDSGVDIIWRIVLIVLIFLIIAIFVTNHFINPYTKLFDDLEEGISRAYKGDFSFHVTTSLSDEAGKVAERLNDLSEIFRFKKTIEMDEDKESIYRRIAHILEARFYINAFVMMENDTESGVRQVVYSSDSSSWIEGVENSTEPSSCRALRTGKDIFSTDFHEICATCHIDGAYSMCLPFIMSNKNSITLHIQTQTEDELERIRKYVPIIRNYFELAQPVLETKLLMKILEESSLVDGMTGLYNRRFMDQFIDTAVYDDSKQFATLMIDIDHFKSINDTYGHDVGDKILKGLSEILQKNTKGSDLAIRFGGEEFLIVLFEISKENAYKIAESIRKEFHEERFYVKDEIVQRTLSAGVAFYPEDSRSPWQVLKFADVALYEAKNGGRDRVVVFEPNMYTEAETSQKS